MQFELELEAPDGLTFPTPRQVDGAYDAFRERLSEAGARVASCKIEHTPSGTVITLEVNFPKAWDEDAVEQFVDEMWSASGGYTARALA